VKKLKLKILIPVLLVLVGGGVGYTTVLAPAAPAEHHKVEGTLLPMGEKFIVNLNGGRYGQVAVSLLIDGHAPAGGGHGAAGDVALLPQNDLIRAIITDNLTGLSPEQLTDRDARHRVLQKLLKDLKHSTDEPITRVLFTDLAVQ
jgi:flagellar basal body-associated protein FliL